MAEEKFKKIDLGYLIKICARTDAPTATHVNLIRIVRVVISIAL